MLNLDEILRSNKPIYVLNKSNPTGRVILTLSNPSTGRTESVTIPATWVPICITDLVPRELLSTSMDFRNYVLSGVLEIISEQEAKNLLSQPEAKEELERIYASQYKQEVSARKAAEDLQEKSDVNPRVQDILLRLETGTISVGSALNKLKAMRHNLAAVDYSFIVANSPSDKIRRWAEKQLQDKQQQ